MAQVESGVTKKQFAHETLVTNQMLSETPIQTDIYFFKFSYNYSIFILVKRFFDLYTFKRNFTYPLISPIS
jgi:hypothetical protein